MSLKRIKVATAILAIAAAMFVVTPPKSSQALFVDWVNAALQAVGHSIQGFLLGVDSAMNSISATLDSVERFVNGLPIQYGPARKALGVAVTTCDLLGGDVFALGDLSNELSTKSSASDTASAGSVKGVTTKIPNSTPIPPSSAAVTITPEGLTAPALVKIPTTNDQVSAAVNNDARKEQLSNTLMSIGDKTKSNMTLLVTKKMGLLRYRQVCYKTIDTALKSSMLFAAWNEQLKEAIQDTLVEMEPKMAAINGHIAGLEEQLNLAKKELFEALATSIAVDVNEQNTEEALNEVNPKLTVANYEEAVDALTKLVYAPRMIVQSYKDDKSQQLLMTSFLNSEIARDQSIKDDSLTVVKGIVEAINTKSCPQAYELYANDGMDEDVLRKMVSSVSPECASEVNYSAYEEKFKKLMADSRNAAEKEITNGGGFMSIRVCLPAGDEEKVKLAKSIEIARKAISSKQAQREYEGSGNMYDSGYRGAVNEAVASSQAMLDYATEINGGITEQCSDIQKAGSLAKSTIENYLKQKIDQNTNSMEKYPQQAGKYSDGLRQFLFGKVLQGDVSGGKGMLSNLGKDSLKILTQPSEVRVEKKSSSEHEKTSKVTEAQIKYYTKTGDVAYKTVITPKDSTTVTRTAGDSSVQAGAETGSSHSTSSSSSGANATAGAPQAKPNTGVKGVSTVVKVIPYVSPRGNYGGGY